MAIPVFDPIREFYDKWEMHRLLSQESTAPAKLLATELLSAQSLTRMLKRYRSVYVKPLGTWGGKQISRIDRVAGSDTWRWRRQGRLKASPAYTLAAVRARILRVYLPRHSIVQQAAPVLSIKGRPFDIRVHMQREPDRSWVCAGILVRVSGTQSIVSNVGATEGKVLPLADVTKIVLRSPAIRKQVPISAEQAGLAIAHSLDRYQDFEEIGVDLGLGRKGKLWVFEVNTNDRFGSPSQKLFLQLPDQTIYQRMRARTPHRIPT
ncbi:MAG: YheC/YheD family protein [Firmicutes bacterium]|nr:YheC/YheD family protein [Bacillota bacterium]